MMQGIGKGEEEIFFKKAVLVRFNETAGDKVAPDAHGQILKRILKKGDTADRSTASFFNQEIQISDFAFFPL